MTTQIKVVDSDKQENRFDINQCKLSKYILINTFMHTRWWTASKTMKIYLFYKVLNGCNVWTILIFDAVWQVHLHVVQIHSWGGTNLEFFCISYFKKLWKTDVKSFTKLLVIA